MINVVKATIALPKEDFKLVEQIRKETGKSRSEVLLDAFRAWMKARRQVTLDDHYAEAYRKKPENVLETKAWMKAGEAIWEKETW